MIWLSIEIIIMISLIKIINTNSIYFAYLIKENPDDIYILELYKYNTMLITALLTVDILFISKNIYLLF